MAVTEKVAQEGAQTPEGVAEEWRPIAGNEGRYEVSNMGRVRSLPRIIHSAGRKPYFKQGQILTTIIDIVGYPRIAIWDPARRASKGYRVHALVCATFHGPAPTPKHEVRHLNGDPTDNRAVNLAWGTRTENVQDMVRHGTHPMSSKTHCKYGHEFTAENTCRGPRDTRGCYECTKRRSRDLQRIYRARKKQEAAKDE